ncbi:hypothetical protein J437_LFUL018405, partial [Ladona fulva]
METFSEEVKILGVKWKKTLKATVELNWREKITKLRNFYQQQRQRNSNLLEKVIIVNDMALAKCWYIAQVLPMRKQTECLAKIISGKFLWSSYFFRTAFKQNIIDFNEGGLGLIDLGTKAKALLIKQYIKDLSSEDSEVKKPSQTAFDRMGEKEDFKKFISTFCCVIQNLPEGSRATSKMIQKIILEKVEVKQTMQYPINLHSLNLSSVLKILSGNDVSLKNRSELYVLINNLYPTNERLHRIGKQPHEMCEICGQTDTDIHRFLSCSSKWGEVKRIYRTINVFGGKDIEDKKWKRKNYLEGDINQGEVEAVFKARPNNKSPGVDGIPYEFYKTYWSIIGEELCNVLKECFKEGRLDPEQKTGIIVQLPKIMNPQRCTDYRPITLTTTDYKIMAKIIKGRIQSVLGNKLEKENY